MKEASPPCHLALVLGTSTHVPDFVDEINSSDHIVVAEFSAGEALYPHICSVKADAIVIIADLSDGKMLLETQQISSHCPMPIIVFTRDDSSTLIDLAVKSGISAYVVDGLDSRRLKPVLQVAVSRFRENQRILEKLSRAESALEERKQIDRAKGIIMKFRNCSEDQAYKALRKLAMDRGKPLAEIAEQVIIASEVL
ncbi:MAG: ANTAR domain-containing protein [Pseudomonadota bacterium]|nr:ANTAR domain-containing protein [Pseudomonadota bacterium]